VVRFVLLLVLVLFAGIWLENGTEYEYEDE